MGRSIHKLSQGVQHFGAIPYNEIGTFMAVLRTQNGIVERALEFAILTAARPGEVIGARWSEIDFAAKTWTVRRERTKAGWGHRIVLSDAAVAVLDLVIDRKHEFVFTRAGCRPLSGGLMLMSLKRMNCGDVTTHGFRATFNSWAAEHTAYPRELMEIALSLPKAMPWNSPISVAT